MSRAFVTGGSGFIGQVLVKRLLKDGHKVLVLVRSDASASRVRALGADYVRGELTDPTTWQDAVTGSDVFFHLAAETDITADRARHELVTVSGTQAAIAAARYARVPRFILCGSEAALLAGEPLIEADETAPLRPDSEAAYSATKAMAEALVLNANGPGFASVSIRPRFVWGPESILISGLVKAVEAGEFAWIGGGRHITDVTYVDNAVEGLMLGWHRGEAGEAYFITDQHRVILREFLETQFALYGVNAAIPDMDLETAEVHVPVPGRWFLGQSCTLKTEKAVSALGYSPMVTQKDGFEAVRAALRSDRE